MVDLPGRQRWAALSVLLLAGFMDLLDNTIVFVAMPRIAADLGVAYASLEWVVAAYSLAFGVGLITGGRLGDIYGRERVFLMGVAGFTAASTAAGVAPTAEVLIASRALQGAMAALMIPQILSTAQVMFPPNERFAAFAVSGAVLSLAAVVGPSLGGLLTELDLGGLSWRPIFLVNLPVGAVALVGGGRLVPPSRAPAPLRLDLLGVGLVTAGLLLVLDPLIEGRALGWPTWTFASISLSVPVFVMFGLWQLHKARTDGSPLIAPALFRTPSFVAGLLVGVGLYSGLASFWFVLVLWLQVGLGFGPLTTAVAGLAWPLAVIATSAFAVKLGGQGRRLIATGLALMSGGVIVVSATIDVVGPAIGPLHLAPGLAIGGIGLGLAAPSLLDSVLGEVPPGQAGSASGVVNTIAQVCSAIGIAIVGVIFFGALEPAMATSAEALTTAVRQALSFHVVVLAISASLTLLLPSRMSNANRRGLLQAEVEMTS